MAATRVWGAFETLGKNGLPAADVVLDGGRARPTAGSCSAPAAARIATFPTPLGGPSAPVVFTMLAEEKE